MNLYLAIFLGGGLGSISRFLISGWLNSGTTNHLPWGTISANVLSSILLGALVGKYQNQQESFLYLMLAIGFCGAFSTFSTFSLENFNFLKEGAYFLLITNIFVNLSLCIAAVALSYNLAK